jgi:rubrerythrin
MPEKEKSELERLFKVADDEESVMLQQLAVKAGILWKCGKCGCYWDVVEEGCGNCGAERSANQEDD